jgi:hypothetical protein
MVENRWQIVIGAMILLLILLTGAFSLGVYVGRHGLSREGLRYKPPESAAAIGTAPGDRASGFPDRQPDLIGRLRSISSKALELATPDGVRLTLIDENTRFRDAQNQAFNPLDLELGENLGVFGKYTGNGGRQLQATLIIRLLDRPAAQPGQ